MRTTTLTTWTLTALLGVGCSGGSNPSPTAPSPSPAPPAPAPLVLTFTPTSPNPSGATLSIQNTTRGAEAGKVTMAIWVHNAPPFHKVRGEVRWNPELLEFDSWGRGAMLDTDGMDWTFFTSGGGRITLWLDRPSTLPAVFGTGEVFAFRLRPRAGVRSGSTALVWDAPRLLTAGLSQVVSRGVGGTVTIQ
jgi:hypothetical protein